MFGLRKVSAATSALPLPWAISARTSDSRSVSRLMAPGPVDGRRTAGTDRWFAHHDFCPACTASIASTSSRAARVLDRSPPRRRAGLDQRRAKVPGVNDHLAGPRVGDQHVDLVAVGLGLRECVVQRDVDVLIDRLVRVDFDDEHAVAIPLEHLGQAEQHNFVVGALHQQPRRGLGIRPSGSRHLCRRWYD